jgi:hypothetical protein
VRVEPRFHARATYRDKLDRGKTVDLFVYSAGESTKPFELHLSTQAECIRGGKAQIISDWRSENQKLRASGNVLDSVNIADPDFDLHETKGAQSD